MNTNRLASFAAAAVLATSLFAAHADSIFTIRQTYTVDDLPPGAKQVRGWFWMPEDRPEQKVLETRILNAPDSLRVTRDPQYGRKWLYAEVAADTNKPLTLVTEFKVLRRAVKGMADPSKARPLSEEDKRAFAFELRRDEKHMEVNPEIQKIANELAGPEKNPVILAKRFFDYVIEKSDHYSKWGAMPKGKCLGDAMECLSGKGDCCTDQHALFIALCRAKDIPCRLFYGSRLKPENLGKNHDPGYRCWPNFFAPGIGWVPLDISSADTAGNKAYDFFGGLDENRVEWAEGRDFDLEPRSAVRPDLVIRAWVEVDGKPLSSFTRVVNFQRESVPTVAPTLSAKAP
jgi:transglutaminase-like putative cysteine protease